ncbi:hypothetical protein NLI96_g7994 [Meripilus lineatus]|uniref:DH domain-containing protein n=1 Tax=Meripilus lineatus TaxID=2056292 RepID=A0AAD5YCF3_9APHY|nr:hypothetical protein NLI96_g7994 [Physisporinus lineatus]
MFRRPQTAPSPAASISSFGSPPDQSSLPHRPPRSKLRKPQPPSNHPYAARTLQPSFNHLNAILPSNTRPTSILRDSAVIDLTDANSTSGHLASPPVVPRSRNSLSNSTVWPLVVLTHPVSNSLSSDHPLPPLPSPTQAQPQNVSCFSRTSVQALTSVLSSKASPSRKLTKRRTLSGSAHPVVLDRPLPPPPPAPQPAADEKDTSTKGDHQRTRRSRSILGVRIPMVTDSSKKRSSDIAEARPPVPRVPTQEPLEPGSKSLPDPYAQPVEPPTLSTATIYTPFSAAASPNSPTSSSPPHASHSIIHKRTPSGALSELAFTGATALSSSALAHLTSRLSLREDHSPEKTVLPIYSSNPNDHNSVFDPYAVSQQQPLPDSFLDHAVSEDGYTIGCAAAFDVSSVFRRRSHKGESGGKMRAQTLHVSASATFVRADRHNTPPQRTSPTHHQITRPLALSTSGSGSSASAIGSGVGGWSGGWNENDGASMTMRRWTLALTDVSDEVLVQELEKIRKEGRERERERKKSGTGTANGGGSEGGHGQGRGRRMSRVGSPPKPDDYIFGGPTINGTAAVGTATSAVDDRSSSRDQAQIARVQSQKQRKKFSIEDEGRSIGGSESDEDLPSGVANGAMTEEGLDEANDDDEDPSTEDEDAGWKTARRALLCCRELVRTERTYQARLRQLLQGDVQFDTQNPTVPSLILSYLPPLLLASEAFLSRLEDDPSAWGVSAALLACEEEIEGAFVAWCEVVGELFVDSPESTPTSPKKLVRKTTVSTSECSGTESRSRVASTFGGRGRTRSVVSVTSSASHSHESSAVHRPRATTSYIPNHSPYPPMPPSPPVFPPIRGHPYNPAGPQGMFTAALGTGLAWGLSPHSSEKSGLLDHSAPRVITSLSSPISPSTSNGGATSATTSPNSTSQALSAPHSRSGSSTGLGRTFNDAFVADDEFGAWAWTWTGGEEADC